MAPVINFSIVPKELQAVAEACRDFLDQAGYTLKFEHSEDDFPENATIFVKHGHERRFYLFDAQIKKERIALWNGYGRSCTSATLVVLCLPDSGGMDAASLAEIRSLGLGLMAMSPNGLLEIVAPTDLSLNIALPPLGRHRKAIRRELSKAYQKFGRGEWKDGFESACKIVEKHAKAYLSAQASGGVLQVPGKKGIAKTLSPKQVRRMPLGALKDVFCDKLSPNQIDALLCSGLKRLNPDRIQVAHAIGSSRAEQRLRNSVGRHMWTIDNLLRKLAA